MNCIQLYIHQGSNIIGLFLAHYTCQTYSLIFQGNIFFSFTDFGIYEKYGLEVLCPFK